MRLYTMDAWVDDGRILVDAQALRVILRGAAERGSLTVLDEAFHVFPNGAVTGVLVLAQSHLSVHTWPERLLANVDLLSCGEADGARVLEEIRRAIGAGRADVTCLERARA
jgi:S-adenosylmethionine decarboxylase